MILADPELTITVSAHRFRRRGRRLLKRRIVGLPDMTSVRGITVCALLALWLGACDAEVRPADLALQESEASMDSAPPDEVPELSELPAFLGAFAFSDSLGRALLSTLWDQPTLGEVAFCPI